MSVASNIFQEETQFALLRTKVNSKVSHFQIFTQNKILKMKCVSFEFEKNSFSCKDLSFKEQRKQEHKDEEYLSPWLRKTLNLAASIFQ